MFRADIWLVSYLHYLLIHVFSIKIEITEETCIVNIKKPANLTVPDPGVEVVLSSHRLNTLWSCLSYKPVCPGPGCLRLGLSGIRSYI